MFTIINMNKNNDIQNNEECDKLLDDILRELEIAKDQSNAIANKLHNQTEKLDNTTNNEQSIDHEMDVSGWHLDYIRATFGKVYKKIHKYPLKEKAKSALKLISLKSKIVKLRVNNIEESHNDKKTKLDDISKVISELNQISMLNSSELDKQNSILDYNIDMVDTVDDKMFTNRNKIKKILK